MDLIHNNIKKSMSASFHSSMYCIHIHYCRKPARFLRVVYSEVTPSSVRKMHYSPKEYFTSFSILYFKGLVTDVAPPAAELAGSNFIYDSVHTKDYNVGLYVYIHIVYIYLIS